MKSIFAALALLSASATAIPSLHNVHQHHHVHKREAEVVTQTKFVMETQIAYKTAWVYPDGSPAVPVASQPVAQPQVVPSVAPVAPAPPAKSSVHVPPPPPPKQTHHSAPAAPAQSAPVPVASHAPPPLAPVVHSTPAAAAAPASSAPVVAPAPAAAPAPAPAPASSGSFTGQMTYYDVGMGSCGFTSTPSEAIVAIPVSQMNNPANPNANPLCGKMVNIHYGGKTKSAKIVDTCMGCKSGDLDMSTSLFSYFAPMSAGRVGGMTWSFA